MKNGYPEKSEWAPGPWHDEPDRLEWRDPKTGLPCLIVRNDMGALCGYAAVPPEHPLHGRGYDEVQADVHGGLTYAGSCSGDICHVAAPDEPKDVWWFGFDCAHAFDLCPGMVALLKSLEFRRSWAGHVEYRTIDYVKAEVTSLAEQLAYKAT